MVQLQRPSVQCHRACERVRIRERHLPSPTLHQISRTSKPSTTDAVLGPQPIREVDPRRIHRRTNRHRRIHRPIRERHLVSLTKRRRRPTRRQIPIVRKLIPAPVKRPSPTQPLIRIHPQRNRRPGIHQRRIRMTKRLQQKSAHPRTRSSITHQRVRPRRKNPRILQDVHIRTTRHQRPSRDRVHRRRTRLETHRRPRIQCQRRRRRTAASIEPTHRQCPRIDNQWPLHLRPIQTQRPETCLRQPARRIHRRRRNRQIIRRSRIRHIQKSWQRPERQGTASRRIDRVRRIARPAVQCVDRPAKSTIHRQRPRPETHRPSQPTVHSRIAEVDPRQHLIKSIQIQRAVLRSTQLHRRQRRNPVRRTSHHRPRRHQRTIPSASTSINHPPRPLRHPHTRRDRPAQEQLAPRSHKMPAVSSIPVDRYRPVHRRTTRPRRLHQPIARHRRPTIDHNRIRDRHPAVYHQTIRNPGVRRWLNRDRVRPRRSVVVQLQNPTHQRDPATQRVRRTQHQRAPHRPSRR